MIPAARWNHKSNSLHPVSSGQRRQGGVALLVVLLTVTLLTIVVVEFTYSTQVDEHIALSSRNALQALYLARSGLNVGKSVLELDRDLQLNDVDSAHDLWARSAPAFRIGDGSVSVTIKDESGKINLNDLLSNSGTITPSGRKILTRLFAILGIDPHVLSALLDWLDTDSEPESTPPGAEAPYYLSLTPPVEPRNGTLLTFPELTLVRGIDRGLLSRLASFVTVLPRTRQLLAGKNQLTTNINTAPPEVIFSLSDKLLASPGVVSRIVERRQQAPIENMPSLKEIAGVTEAITDAAGHITFSSGYFTITSVGRVADIQKGVAELVSRSSQDTGGIETLAWRTTVARTSSTTAPAADFLAALATLKAGLEASRTNAARSSN